MDEQYTIDAALFEAAAKQIFWKQQQQALPRLIPGLFVSFFIVAQWLLYRKSRRMAAEVIANGSKEPKHYTVSSSSAGLTIKSPERKLSYSWGEFNGAIYSKDFLLLPHPKDGIWSLPRQQLSDDFARIPGVGRRSAVISYLKLGL